MTPEQKARVEQMFAECAAEAAYAEELENRMRLEFWSGPTWADTPPNRLFGSWVKSNGEAT